MNMIKIETADYLHMLWILPVLIIIWYTSGKFYSRKIFYLISKNKRNDLYTGYSKIRKRLKAFLLLTTLVLLILALANFKIGTRLVELKREGIDIAIAIDLSRSMLAEDIKPSRIKKTKHAIRNFINKLEGDRISLIGFTSQAFVQCPLTTDYDAALMFLDLMDVDLLPQDGTSLAEAISTSNKVFDKESKQHKLLIIISDGEDHEEGVTEAVSEAVSKGVIISTIGIGSLSGVPIPVEGDFLKDKDGNTVLTRLNDLALKKIAVEGNGNFYIATTSEGELRKIFEDIRKIEKKEFKSKIYSDFEDRFQVFILIALLFLTIYFFVGDKKKESGLV